MPELIVLSRIDGNPVAWRCSACRQIFSIPGQLSTQLRRKKVKAEFESHLHRDHPDNAQKPGSLIAS
ncbi:MAG TPA: hypothetical protein VFI72_13485 [Candidatus Angelobacter sp.]|nr:hypothetical protein [Candidatus Angelobacter sp.]